MLAKTRVCDKGGRLEHFCCFSKAAAQVTVFAHLALE
jgi:hypothetical protein